MIEQSYITYFKNNIQKTDDTFVNDILCTPHDKLSHSIDVLKS